MVYSLGLSEDSFEAHFSVAMVVEHQQSLSDVDDEREPSADDLAKKLASRKTRKSSEMLQVEVVSPQVLAEMLPTTSVYFQDSIDLRTEENVQEMSGLPRTRS